jgi:hypothetical protein
MVTVVFVTTGWAVTVIPLPFELESGLTATTLGLLLVQVTVLYVALGGPTVAVSVPVIVLPVTRVRLVELRDTPVATTGDTVTVQVAVLPLSVVATMTAVPTPLALTVVEEPFAVFTAASVELLLVQVTMAPGGVTMAVSAGLV